MKHIIVLFFPLLFIPNNLLLSQSCVQGIINIYTPVVDFECSGNTVVVGSSNGFQPNDLVLLIQMQGATCNLDNTASFGDLVALNHAGNYEINRVSSIQGNKIAMQFMRTRDYDLGGKIQLIRIPEYTDVSVCDLTCKPWDGTTGGVLILRATGQVTMEGPMDVSAKGFRGGLLNNASGTSNHELGYFYAPDPFISAAKGEGIAQIDINHSYGRGKVVNGGGGGNAHNSGGGGGGSFGDGGRGGTEFSHTVPDPNTFGIGGLNLMGDNSRIFMGGGGGSGHSNDNTGTGGGNGGGIVAILAGSITSNGFSILSNGENKLGGTNNNDGQGGGGAGGTIAIYAESITGNLDVQARGGSGGNSIFLQTPSQKIGPGGGGGGGGLIQFHNTSGINGNFMGGPHGLANNSDPYGSQDGLPGTAMSNVLIPLDTVLFSLPVDLTIIQPECQNLSNGAIQVNTEAETYILNGNINTSGFFNNLDTGTYLLTLVLADGCEASTSTVLSSQPVITSQVYYTICPGSTITINGNTYDAPGVFAEILPAQSFGCDTFLVTHIEFSEYVLTFSTVELCPGYSIDVNGVVFTEPGLLIDTIPTVSAGCDTIHKTSVIWGFSPEVTRIISFCPGDTIFLDSLLFTEPFTYIDTIPAAVGCDTIRTTTGIWQENPQVFREIFLCPNDSVMIGGQYYTGPAEVQEILTSQETCDTIRLNTISIYPDESVSFLEPSIEYCTDNPIVLQSPYPGTVWNNSFESQTFSISSTGTVTVQFLDAHGCIQRDTATVVSCCNIDRIYVPNVFAPGNNPPNDRFRISANPACSLLHLRIYNRWGALLFQTDTPDTGWDGMARGKPCESGVYVWVLEISQNGSQKIEVLKGDVTIIR